MNSNPWTGYSQNSSSAFSNTNAFSSSNAFSNANAFSQSTMQTSSSNYTSEMMQEDTISDLCINRKGYIAAAGWKGLSVWALQAQSQLQMQNTNSFAFSSTTTTQTNQMKGNLLEDIKLPEPLLRCTFDTMSNGMVYVGSTSGKISQIDLGSMNISYAGHHTSMVTGLKYSREKTSVVSASTDGSCYIWDARKSQRACLQFNSNINCTNIDIVRNSIAICGIDLEDGSPVVQMFDFRNIKQNPDAKPNPVKTFKSSSDKNAPDFVQFTSVGINRDGSDFIACSLGGYFVCSKGNNFRIHPKTDSNSKPSINAMAILPNPLTQDKIKSHGCFVGRSDGKLTALSVFRTINNQNDNLEPIKIIADDFSKTGQSYSQNPPPVTACAVSPDNEYLVYARGYDYSKGYQQPSNAYVFFKSISIENDFKKPKI